jgi:hypothetical protein
MGRYLGHELALRVDKDRRYSRDLLTVCLV